MVSAPVWEFRPDTIVTAGFPDSNAVKAIGKPDAGKPHVRFDEGEQISALSLVGSILYWLQKKQGNLNE